MESKNLIQGTPEWHAHRANHFNASDAPAMMGVSPYETRTELLNRLKTGITPEVSPELQRRFDDGHRFEALARPVLEERLKQELYPVTGTSGKLSASFDGVTMAEDLNWEHKTLNETLRGISDGKELNIMYRVQCEHQMIVLGNEKTLFSATKWDSEGNLLEEEHYSDPELRQQIIDGWNQLEKDLESHVPTVKVAPPVADAEIELPLITVQIKGEVVTNNLPNFKKAADDFLSRANTKLETDKDFINAERDVKICSDAESGIERTKKAMLDQTEDIGKVMRELDLYGEKFRSLRLTLEKLVKSEKEARKQAISSQAHEQYLAHIAELQAEIPSIKLNVPALDTASAMKNKRTIASLQDSVSTALAHAKIAADATAKDIRAKLALKLTEDYPLLFPDHQTLIYKPMDDYILTVNTRIAQHKAAEAEKAAQAVAEAKAKADAAALAAAQQASQQAAVEAAVTAATQEPALNPVKLVQPHEAIQAALTAKARPSRANLVSAIANVFNVDAGTAATWLMEEFSS